MIIGSNHLKTVSMPKSSSWKAVLAETVHYYAIALAGILGMLPFALLGTSGVLFVLGALYAVVWTALVLPTTASYAYFVHDMYCLYLRREPVYLKKVFVETARRIEAAEKMPTHRLHSIVNLSFYINPLSNVIALLLVQAMRWRSPLVHAMWVDAVQSVRPKKAKTLVLLEPETQTEFGAPIVERAARRHSFDNDFAIA